VEVLVHERHRGVIPKSILRTGSWRAKDAARACLVLAIGCAAALLANDRTGGTDIEPLLAAGRAWWSGGAPYAVRAEGWEFPSLHPFPAILLVLPLAWSPLDPSVVFAFVGSAWWAWSISSGPAFRQAFWALPTFVWIHAVRMAQWAPLLVAAALNRSWAGGLLVCKPSIGIALWLAYPSGRAVVSGLLVLATSVWLYPTWPWEWWQAVSSTQHLTAPIALSGGPVLLAALWRWREPEARLLAALACVPQSGFLYDALPLFLVPRRSSEGALLAVGALAVVAMYPLVVPPLTDPMLRYLAERQAMGQWIVWCLYWPSLIMVLRRRV
jgi:hypothetical protein